MDCTKRHKRLNIYQGCNSQPNQGRSDLQDVSRPKLDLKVTLHTVAPASVPVDVVERLRATGGAPADDVRLDAVAFAEGGFTSGSPARLEVRSAPCTIGDRRAVDGEILDRWSEAEVLHRTVDGRCSRCWPTSGRWRRCTASTKA